MKCRRAKTLIFDFIDGYINDSDRVALEQHLGECPECDAMASGLKKSLDLLHRAPQVQPGENFNWKVRLGIAKERDAAARRVQMPRAWVAAWNTRFAASAVATFAVVVAAGYFALRSFDVTPGEPPTLASSAKTESPAPTPVVPTRYDVPRTGIPGVRPVSTATDVEQGGNLNESGLIGNVPPGFDADSLLQHFAESQAVRLRTQDLQDQVRLLMNELRECENQQPPR